jgi:hypothetical protein
MNSIGSATMQDDGTIVLNLTVVTPDMIGDGQLQYKPTDLEYAEVLSHLDGLKPGESKPVPPWPDEGSVVVKWRGAHR